VRKLTARMLESMGFTVWAVADGQEAVELYLERGSEISLVLLDLTMPRMDGAAAFAQLRRLDPHVRVVLASGYSEEEIAGRFASESLVGVLQKPYSLTSLRELLRGVAGRGS